MSTTTTNYGLIKPDTTDPILIGQLNDNSDAIDAALKENADAIENKPDAADIPTPSTAAPAMDGTAAAGTSTDYARADHVHPSDTSKQDALTTAQLAAINSGINSTKVEQIETNKNNISTINNNLIYSPTQPTGNIPDGAIWINTAITAISDYIKKYHVSKQLFDKSNPNTINGYFNSTGVSIITISANTASIYIPCEPNTQYTINKITTSRFFAGYTTELPDTGVTVSNIVGSSNYEGALTVTTGNNAAYLIAFIYRTQDTVSLQDIYDSIMINKGETASPYEPYNTDIWHSNNT